MSLSPPFSIIRNSELNLLPYQTALPFHHELMYNWLYKSEIKQSPAEFHTEDNLCEHSAAVFKKMSKPVGLNAASKSAEKKAYLITLGTRISTT